jgi:hypothetical protein
MEAATLPLSGSLEPQLPISVAPAGIARQDFDMPSFY